MDNNNWYESNPAQAGEQYNESAPTNGTTQNTAEACSCSSENNAYGFNTSGGGNGGYGTSGNGGYDNPTPPQPPKPPKKKTGVTLTQLIVCMLVVALIGAGTGVLVTSSINNSNNNAAISAMADQSTQTNTTDSASKETSSDDVSDTQAVTDSSAPAETGTTAENGTTPSSNLNISSSAAASGSESEVIRSAMSSVVGIYIGTQQTNYSQYGYSTDGSEDSGEESGSGAGVIITADGYVVTNLHVIESATSISVYLQDGTSYPATVVGYDSKTDLAILKIDATGLPAATIGSSGDVLVGDTVYAIGNPLGVLSSSVSKGIISGLDRTIEVEGSEMTLMQTDAAVNPGNSGGGLFNSAGQLIGIVNCKSMGYDVEGLGFAIPVDTIKPIMVDLIDLGYVTGRPYLGISMQNITLSVSGSNGSNSNGFGQFDSFFPFSGFGQSSYYVNRIQVTAVEDGSAAYNGGMQEGDIIMALDGTEISGSSQLSTLLYEYNVGDVVTITVLRNNESVDLTITLGERTSK